MINIDEIPNSVEQNSTVQITTNKVNYFTHGYFKYPCKFIPNIPRWAINKYSKKGDIVLDPFAGSGTTLVEAILNQRDGLAIDFDPLSQLLTRVKTKTLSSMQLKLLENFPDIFKDVKKGKFTPDLHNTLHWFPENNILALSVIRDAIDIYYDENNDLNVKEFLLVTLASIIRKCSYADPISPKPYVSSKINKKPAIALILFNKTLHQNIQDIRPYSGKKLGQCKVIGDDARLLSSKKFNSKVDLIISSPPYINAFDYVRSLRLENAWLGFYGDTGISAIKAKQIGTETISVSEYKSKIPSLGIETIDTQISNIKVKDLKRANVIWKFFDDMEKHFIQMSKLLKIGGHYIIVVGNSKIRGEVIETADILTAIASRNGYELVNKFSYVIRNRYIRIPRSGQGGLVDLDWVIDLKKT